MTQIAIGGGNIAGTEADTRGHVRTGLSKISVRTFMIAGGLVVAILPAAILGVGSSFENRRNIIDEHLERSAALARGLASQANQMLELRERVLATLGLHLGSLERLDIERVGPFIKRTRDNHPSFDRISVTGTDGIVFAAEPAALPSGKSLVGLDLRERAYFKQVMATGKPVIERNVLIGQASGLPIVVTAAPILDAAGTIKGMVLGSVDAVEVEDFIGRLNFGASGRAGILSYDGKVLADANKDLVLKQAEYTRLPVWQEMIAGERGKLEEYTDLSGTRRLGAFATAPGAGWKVWVSESYEELDSRIANSLSRALVWALVGVGAAILAAVLLARSISRPIDTVRATAERIAAGALDQRAPEDGPQELSALAHALNSMAATLQRMIDGERDGKRRVEKSVDALGVLARRVADGDLAARADVSGDDELARLGAGLNSMTASLESLVSEIHEAAGNVASAAEEILAATTQQVATTTEEATAVRQTAATVTEVRQTSEAAARKTRQVAELAQRMESTAEDGQHAVEEGVRSSEDGKARMEALAERILAFSEQAQAIAEINATVSEIAEQSNLLAVNAGIEAAKAGEAGRGFGVVATEVKELAERSKSATTQVRHIVTEIQKSAQAAVMAAEQGVKAAEIGVSAAKRSGGAIDGLARTVAESSQAAQQILAAAEQQSVGMDQINLAMQNIEQASGQTVAATQQVERAARDLNQIAQKLTGMISSMTMSGARGGQPRHG